jgi:farnesyl diphosphate synthase
MNANSSPFLSRLDATAKDTEDLLDRLLSPAPAAGEISRPARLIEAMRYSSLGGGKRFRPFLVVESAALFAVPRRQALMAGAALECVHCYSLVHDDLPAMDDDALRRGQPTAHKKFDEATAILAGDGLLTLAFDILSRSETHPDPAVRTSLVSALACAAGLGGMVGGQMLDLAAEGRFDGGGPRQLGEKEVRTLQAMKTGALLRFACQAGGILGSATEPQRDALERYGSAVGRASRSRTSSRSRRRSGPGRQIDRQRRSGGQGDDGRHARQRRGESTAAATGGRGRTRPGAVRSRGCYSR